MIDTAYNKPERAIIVGVKTAAQSREVSEENLTELGELAVTAGAEAIAQIVQERTSLDAAYYIGKGKVEELARLAEELDASTIIFDDDLTAVQVRNLERVVKRKIVDRSDLILAIFARHARTSEARTQVELAQLQYMLPRLTRAWTHLSKQYGGIRAKGPGETQIETDRRIIRDRITHLKEKLLRIEEQRKTQTQRREAVPRVCIVGYTNAGKSTLFNLLTRESVLAEDMLFATLDSTTRSLTLGKNKKLLITDTVGFIRKLPHHLVASFRGTLREVREAGHILHVVDCSHPFYEDHIRVVNDTLTELGCPPDNRQLVFNKIDLVADTQRIELLRNAYPGGIILSAAKGINISTLSERLLAFINDDFTLEKLRVPHDDTRTVAAVHALAEVLSVSYGKKYTTITYRAGSANRDKIKRLLHG